MEALSELTNQAIILYILITTQAQLLMKLMNKLLAPLSESALTVSLETHVHGREFKCLHALEAPLLLLLFLADP